MSMLKLIVGLGNPGPSYIETRHNAGQIFVETLAQDCGVTLAADKKFFGLYANAHIQGHDIKLLIPTTYMNRSGQSVAALCQFYKISAEEILVAHDELDIAVGTIKLKQGGGHGGHNGLRDIISALGNNKNFHRLRIGIGHPGDSRQVSDYVLKKAPSDERDKTQACIEQAIHALPTILSGQWQQAMNQLHSFKA